MNKFRPQSFSKKYKLKHRRKFGSDAYNWQSRIQYDRYKKLPLNQITLGRIFSKLHYLGSHSPTLIRKKWRCVEFAFYSKHVPIKANMRYLEQFTIDNWL